MIILHNTHLLRLLLNVPKTAARPRLLYEKHSPPSLWDLSESKYTKIFREILGVPPQDQEESQGVQENHRSYFTINLKP